MIKKFENFNKSEFTFGEILQDLRDDYEINFISNSITQRGRDLDVYIREIDSTHDMFFDTIGDEIKRSPLCYDLIIENNPDNMKSYEGMYDQIEEVVDRFEDKNMYVYSVSFDGFREYVALPKPEEKYKFSIVGKCYPLCIQIVFQSNKRNLEPTTKFGKFIDRFRDKTQTKYSEYSNYTGPR